MDNLQYAQPDGSVVKKNGFKPYYKWIIFNINMIFDYDPGSMQSFKPYYKWIIFNIILIVSGNRHLDKF